MLRLALNKVCTRRKIRHVRSTMAALPPFRENSTFPCNYLQGDPLSVPKTSILMELHDEPGALQEALAKFKSYNVNLTSIESRPNQKENSSFDIYVAFEGARHQQNISDLLKEIQMSSKNVIVVDDTQVPWFPKHIEDLDLIANRVLDAGVDLESDHPGFNDATYRKRRQELASIAESYRHGDRLPFIDYTENEISTWGQVWDKLSGLVDKFACAEYLQILERMKEHCNYGPHAIPQAADISRFLQRCTGFRLRPVAGLLSSRDFLNGLAFRVFFSTQYIRHHSTPLYTPEPDICHELMGHAPMFADPDFADFSQEIGLASLGASDDDIQKLARCYWFSVEFGLSKEQGEIKAYGAGLLSSFGELEYACAAYRPAGDTDERPELLDWNPNTAALQDFPITTYQPVYFVAENMGHAKNQMRLYCQEMKKPFHARYNPLTESVWVDRPVAVLPPEEA